MSGNLSNIPSNDSTDSGNNMTLTNVLQNLSPSVIVNVAGKEKGSDKNEVADERTRKGQFGWFTLGNCHLPYIYRNNDEEYCSVRMAETTALCNYLKFLNRDIYNCINIKSYYVSNVEASLLNQINFIHCDGQFGRDQFTRDLLVKVSDVKEFYQFLATCYTKLCGKSEGESRLGFVMINKDAVVPYTVSSGRKFVPLFYFEGEMEQLKLKSYKLEGWDLSYLKFCCKIQGIKNQLFAHDTCSVIALDDIKLYFPPDTTFEEHWLSKTVDMQMLITGKNQPPMGGWTKQPTTAPPSYSLQPVHPTNATQKSPAQSGYTYKPTSTYSTAQQQRNALTYSTSGSVPQQLYNYLRMT